MTAALGWFRSSLLHVIAYVSPPVISLKLAHRLCPVNAGVAPSDGERATDIYVAPATVQSLRLSIYRVMPPKISLSWSAV
jgi:hypothetical protein